MASIRQVKAGRDRGPNAFCHMNLLEMGHLGAGPLPSLFAGNLLWGQFTALPHLSLTEGAGGRKGEKKRCEAVFFLFLFFFFFFFVRQGPEGLLRKW